MIPYQTLNAALEHAPAEKRFITHWIDEDEREEVSFGQFRSLAHSEALMLCAHGVVPGDCVVVIMPQGIHGMAVFAGAMLLGAVPSFLAYPSFKMYPEKYRAGIVGVSANLRAKVVVLDDQFPDELLSYVRMEDSSRLVRARRLGDQLLNEELPSLQIGAEDLAFVQHSAGTTGLQKGVALTHGAVLRQLQYLAEALAVKPDCDSIFSWLPLYHDMGLVASFLFPLVYHLPVVMQSPLEWVLRPHSMLEAITACRCTLAWQPNFAFQFLARRTPARLIPDYDLSSMRAWINCSEAVRAESLDEFQQAFSVAGVRPGAVAASYAMAENVFAVTQSPLELVCGPRRTWVEREAFRNRRAVVQVPQDSPGSLCFVSSGPLLPGAEVRIVSDEGVPLVPGSVGEILLRSDCLFTGYYNRPDLTSTAISEGWYHTGDLGFLFEDELYVVGRKKDLLIVAGENLHPHDIEEIVCNLPEIHDGRAIALGILNPSLGTEEILVVAEVEREELLEAREEIERELKAAVVAGLGVAVKTVLLKPPKWIVKSTAGKPSRSATRLRLREEHPELNLEE